MGGWCAHNYVMLLACFFAHKAILVVCIRKTLPSHTASPSVVDNLGLIELLLSILLHKLEVLKVHLHICSLHGLGHLVSSFLGIDLSPGARLALS